MNVQCISCRSSKTQYRCGVCAEPLCRGCAQFLDEATFEYLPEISEKLKHTYYCQRCFDENVAPELEQYQETLNRAEQVIVVSKAFKGTLPIIKKSARSVEAKDLPDRQEVIMRLAFLAALQGYNAVIQTDIEREKVRNHGYQKSLWSGRGVPANLDERRLELDEYREEVWRRGH